MANIDNPNPTLRRNPEYGKLLNIGQPVAPPTAHDGLLRDDVTGHLVGIEQVPLTPHPEVGAEYPRWVTPHESHVSVDHNMGGKQETGDFETENEIASQNSEEPGKTELKKDGDNLIVPAGSVVSVPGFEHHVRRGDGAITVLVRNKDEEDRALGERSSEENEPVSYVSTYELAEAERVYEHELTLRENEYREKRLAEIIKERRQAAIDQAEKDLEEQRKQIDALKDDSKPEIEVENKDV